MGVCYNSSVIHHTCVCSHHVIAGCSGAGLFPTHGTLIGCLLLCCCAIHFPVTTAATLCPFPVLVHTGPRVAYYVGEYFFQYTSTHAVGGGGGGGSEGGRGSEAHTWYHLSVSFQTEAAVSGNTTCNLQAFLIFFGHSSCGFYFASTLLSCTVCLASPSQASPACQVCRICRPENLQHACSLQQFVSTGAYVQK